MDLAKMGMNGEVYLQKGRTQLRRRAYLNLKKGCFKDDPNRSKLTLLMHSTTTKFQSDKYCLV